MALGTKDQDPPHPRHPAHAHPGDPRAAGPLPAAHLWVCAFPGAFWAQPHDGDPLGTESGRPWQSGGVPEPGRGDAAARWHTKAAAGRRGGAGRGRGRQEGAGAARGGDKAPAAAACSSTWAARAAPSLQAPPPPPSLAAAALPPRLPRPAETRLRPHRPPRQPPGDPSDGRPSLLEGTMNWHFSFFLLTTVTLPFVCSLFNPLPLEELSSNIGIQVFNQIIKSRPHDNVIVSPHGIASVLGMLQLGADGKTKKQLTMMMRYGVNGVGKMLKKINKAIVSKKNKDIVTMANAMFVKNGFKMELPFVTRNRDVFQCEVQGMNFEDPVSTSNSINLWVKNETRGMIDSLMSPDLIDGSLTKMILVNAVYFKGLWKSRFQPENTKKRTFVTADGKSYQVPMLAQLSVFRIGSTSTPGDLWYHFIELPYHGESISMLIALPIESSTPLSDIIPHISTKTVNSWMSMMVPKRVQVVLPKFTAVAQTDLKEPLKVLGITDLFDPSKSNFAKITRSEKLYVSHILQKAKIEVSEDGTKASATTTAILIARSSPPWFIVDRPFLFFIRHNPTGAILFMGQINKP